MKNRSFLFGALLVFSSLASAAQELHTSYQFYGFSDDLRYCAFEVYATENEDAFSTIYFIDVDKNDYSARPVTTSTPLGENDEYDKILAKTRAATWQKATTLMAQYKIGGNKKGTLIEFKGESNGFGISYEPEQEFNVGKEKYKLVLSLVGTGVTNGSGDEEQMVVVALQHNGQSKVLQPATKVPKSWGSVIGYQLLSVYYLNNKLAVFVEYQGPGFEGVKSTQQMIVTGVLN